MAFTPETDQRLSDWMMAAQSGDRGSYDALLREIAALLRSYFASRAECNEAADDLVQETLVSIHRARHTYMAGRPFAPWMYAIARCRLADHYRRNSRRVPQVPFEVGIDGTEKEPVESVMGDRVRESLAGLPEAQRRVVQMLKLDGLSIKEAARRLEMTEAAVKVAAHRAYERLRRQFGQQEENGNG